MGSIKKIIKLVTSGHKPYDTRIFHKEAMTLKKLGYDVSIIIPHDKDEEKEGIRIISVKLPRNGYEKLLLTPIMVLFKAVKHMGRSIYHIHDSELLGIALLLKLMGQKVIYDAHEDTPQQISYQHWIPKILKKPYAKYYYYLEKLCGKIFDKIIVADPAVVKYFPPKKTTLIRNFPIIQKFKQTKLLPFSQRKNWIIYTGLISEVRGIYQMMEATESAKKQVDIELIVAGLFAPKQLQGKILQKGSLTYYPWMSHDEVVQNLLLSKIGIVILHPVEKYLTAYPVKMFEYMAAGLPVIASKYSKASDFIKECQGGVLVDPLNVEEIADAIIYLLNNQTEAQEMGERGRQLVFEKYNWEKEATKLSALYQDLS